MLETDNLKTSSLREKGSRELAEGQLRRKRKCLSEAEVRVHLNLAD